MLSDGFLQIALVKGESHGVSSCVRAPRGSPPLPHGAGCARSGSEGSKGDRGCCRSAGSDLILAARALPDPIGPRKICLGSISGATSSRPGRACGAPQGVQGSRQLSGRYELGFARSGSRYNSPAVVDSPGGGTRGRSPFRTGPSSWSGPSGRVMRRIGSMKPGGLIWQISSAAATTPITPSSQTPRICARRAKSATIGGAGFIRDQIQQMPGLNR